MSEEAHAFIQSVTDGVRPLHVRYAQALWEAATTGSEEANQREKDAQAEQMRFWADPDRFQQAVALEEAGHPDPVVARTLRVIRLSAAKAQQDEATIEKLTRLEADVRRAYYNYRAEVDGQRLTDNQLEEILTESTDSEEVERAWKASKQVGREVAPQVRELARTRNAAARAAGFRDHFQKSLQLNEIDEGELFDLLSDLDQETEVPFSKLKARIDQERAQRFGVSSSDLGPWHYANRFFQQAPEPEGGELEAAFKGQDPVPLARTTYRGWGLDIEDILERSDLYAREGKNQHAFCLDVDRSGDIRTLNNLEPNFRWANTLLHELGHAVYDKYIDHELPWLLRTPPHTLSTEAIALLAQTVISEPRWMSEVMGVSQSDAEKLAEEAAERDRASDLVFTRWALVMTNFERALYQDPERDLDTLWWDLKQRFQQLRRPSARQNPDWGAKYHVALAPVYYQNYELGLLFAAQLRQTMRQQLPAFVGEVAVGDWLRDKVFRPGARQDWSSHIKSASGHPLSTEGFIARF